MQSTEVTSWGSKADIEAAVTRLDSFAISSQDGIERLLFDVVRNGLRRRRYDATGPLASYLGLSDKPLMAGSFAFDLAQAVFGDRTLVYDVSARLRGPAGVSVLDALQGAPLGFEPPVGETLARFVATRRGGVVVLDDLQSFEVCATEILAGMSEDGMMCPEGSVSPTLSAKNIIVIALARVALPPVGQLDDLVAAGAAACAALPEHLRPWVTGRFLASWHNMVAAFEHRYETLKAEGRLDEYLSLAPDDAPGAPHTDAPSPSAEDLVRDVYEIVDRDPEPARFDVFISYSWSRNTDDSSWLARELRSLGLSVYLDRDQLAPEGVAAESRKEFLIRELRWAIRSARAHIVFAAMARPYRKVAGLTDEQAITRGLAMRTEESGMIAWSWQTLEIRECHRFLFIDKDVAAAVQGDQFDQRFADRRFTDRASMLPIVTEYLRFTGVLA